MVSRILVFMAVSAVVSPQFSHCATILDQVSKPKENRKEKAISHSGNRWWGLPDIPQAVSYGRSLLDDPIVKLISYFTILGLTAQIFIAPHGSVSVKRRKRDIDGSTSLYPMSDPTDNTLTGAYDQVQYNYEAMIGQPQNDDWARKGLQIYRDKANYIMGLVSEGGDMFSVILVAKIVFVVAVIIAAYLTIFVAQGVGISIGRRKRDIDIGWPW